MKNSELLEELRKAVKDGKIKGQHESAWVYTADKRGDWGDDRDWEYWR